MAYESFVGARYLMAKQRSRVVSIITLIAVGGVALGVTALIVVLSVMGGFTEDLTSNILGARAHVVIQDGEHRPMPEAGDLADEALTHERVVGASPFIESEVMVSSRTNLSGVILRGIDTERVGDVSDLLQDIEQGRLEYLEDDSELLAELEGGERRDYEEVREKLQLDSDIEVEAPDGDPAAPDMPGGFPSPDPPAEGDGDDLELPSIDEEPGDPASPMDDDEQLELPSIEGDSGDSAPAIDDDAELELPSIDGKDAQEEVAEEEQGVEDSDVIAEASGGMPPIFDDAMEESDLPALPSMEDPASEAGPSGQQWETSGVPGIIVGSELATSLRVGLGDEVNVVTPRGEIGPTGPIPRSRPFRVVGVFRSGMYEYDANHAYTAMGDAGRLFDYDGATGVELRAEDVDDSVTIAEDLRQQMGDQFLILDWQEMNSSLFFALRLERIAMFIVLTFIILVASFSIVAMLIMIVIEKAREIAILKSLGASNGGIMRIFMFQGLVIGVVGALFGLGAGLGICYYLEEVGIPLDSEVYYISTLPVDVNSVEVVAVVACAIIISFLATLYPSYQAARLNPVEGLRYD